MAILRLTVVNVSIRMAYVCCICTFTLKYPPTHDLVGFVIFYVVCFSGFLLNAGGGLAVGGVGGIGSTLLYCLS